ncbi:MAG: hypothetical protein P1U89_23400 [Verrucomicrobiales bacterium]|nr:hypothetical protein [Verrucomicrobiales bacterium]
MRLSLLISIITLGLVSLPSDGGDLTPEQVESLRLKLAQVKESLDGHISTRNQSARSTFMSASSDPRAAVKLYLECYKKVHYDMEGRSESDFRAWRETQENRLKDDKFIASLMIQLRYLALSCHAAEVEEIDEVFSPLTTYVESLSRMEELPDNLLTSNVANSIFAQAYDLDKTLSSNEGWELVPFNIPGIYDKTILPHIRANSPNALMSVWDKRIDQQKRLVLFFESKKEEALRGMDRDQKAKMRSRQDNQRGIMKSHDLDDFNRDTLPKLQWSKMKDMYLYVDQLEAAKLMLTFVQTNLTTPNGQGFFNDFMGILEGSLKKEEPAPQE